MCLLRLMQIATSSSEFCHQLSALVTCYRHSIQMHNCSWRAYKAMSFFCSLFLHGAMLDLGM